MSRDRTYNADEGEFVDFATLDDWREQGEKQRAKIAELRSIINQARLAFGGHVSIQSAIDMIDNEAESIC